MFFLWLTEPFWLLMTFGPVTVGHWLTLSTLEFYFVSTVNALHARKLVASSKSNHIKSLVVFVAFSDHENPPTMAPLTWTQVFAILIFWLTWWNAMRFDAKELRILQLFFSALSRDETTGKAAKTANKMPKPTGGPLISMHQRLNGSKYQYRLDSRL